MKKLISVLLLVMAMLCMTVGAADAAEDFAWSIDENGVLTVTGNGAMPDYAQYFDTAPWYDNRDSIKSIVIGEGITHIGTLAFYNCQSYDSVTIPASVTSIGDAAFQYCQSFTTINISEDNPAFKVVDGILFSKDGTTIVKCPEGMMTSAYTVPDGVTHIGAHAFENCWNMPSVTLPESVVSFGDSAFALCSKLTSVNIPSNVTVISKRCFAFCDALLEIELPSGVTFIGNEAFIHCTALTEIALPESLTSIGAHAFAYCKGFTSITVPASVDTIGEAAFRVCIGVPAITVDAGNSSFKAVDGVLFDADMTTIVCYPAGKVGTAYTIPSTVTTVYGGAFEENTNLTEITLSPETVTIEDSAFYKCAITSVVIPSKTKYVGYYAFANSSSLDRITVYSLNTEYKYGALNGCAETLVVTCYKDSTADTYASQCGYTVEYINCDFDGDGTVSVQDVMVVLKALLDGEYTKEADMNGNGKLDLVDVLRVLKASVA